MALLDSIRSKPAVQLVVSALLCAVIAVCGFRVVGMVRSPEFNVTLHKGVGEVLAQETCRMIGSTGSVVVITGNPAESAVLKTQVDQFKKTLKNQRSVHLVDVVTIASEAKRNTSPGTGLNGKDFIEIVRKHPTAAAFVSFAGMPNPEEPELKNSKRITGKCLAETSSRTKLKRLFRAGFLDLAIVPRFAFPAPGPREPSSRQEWFDRNFQIVRPVDLLPVNASVPE